MKHCLPGEPRLRILNVSIPWYRLSQLQVPYTRWHVALYLLTLCMLTLGAGGTVICLLGTFFNLPALETYIWTAPFLGLGLWCNQRGRERWYFEEIELVATECSSPRLTREMVQLRRQANQILDWIDDTETAPAERQSLRQELKGILCELATAGDADEVRSLHERAPYLKLTA